MKQCEQSQITPALIKTCHGTQNCDIKADPIHLNAPQCSNQHIVLKVAYACMNKVGLQKNGDKKCI